MRTISAEELKTILEKHKHWINEDCEGWEDMCANLRYADLRGADLRGADLGGADLGDASVRDAHLTGADLTDANLRGADFRGADLTDANLGGADLRGVDLTGANLKGANLKSTDLTGADLRGAKNVPYIPMICPEEGEFIGWKKAGVYEEEDDSYYKVIVKLEIPEDAKRSSATSRKCRCNKAKVLEIYNLDGTAAKERVCHSDYDNDFVYEVGKTVEVDDFCEDRWNECARGIHFFINRQEAIDY